MSGYTSTDAEKRSGFTEIIEVQDRMARIAFDELSKPWAQIFPQVVNVMSSSKKDEKFNIFAAPGSWYKVANEGEEFTYANHAEGTTITATPDEYRQAFDVTEVMMEDKQWPKLMSGVKDLMRGALEIEEIIGHLPYNNAFSSGLMSDGSYMCAAAHDPVNSATTWSNAITTEMSYEALKEMIELSYDILGEDGIRSMHNYDTLFIPPPLEEMAYILLQSENNPNTQNKQANFVRSKIKKVIVSPWLTSDTAFFLIASGEKAILPQFINRVPKQFRSDVDVYSHNILNKGRMRAICTAYAGQGVIGSTGTVAVA